jgi:DNA-binding MarR family transcriptional regulator
MPKRPPKIMTIGEMYATPAHLVRRLHQISVALFYDELSEFELNPVQYAAMVAIKNSPGIHQRALGLIAGIDRSTIGSTANRLEELGLIKRITPADNQRVKALSLTPKGERLLVSAIDATERVQKRLVAPLDADELETLLDLMSRLVRFNNDISRAPSSGEL